MADRGLKWKPVDHACFPCCLTRTKRPEALGWRASVLDVWAGHEIPGAAVYARRYAQTDGSEKGVHL